MPIPAQQAADALENIERANRRSVEAYRNLRASPHLILWGVIWAAGYGLEFAKPRWLLVWPALLLAGILGSFWFTRRQAGPRSRPFAWRYALTAAAVLLFITALFAILPPRSGAQVGAVFPLLIAFWYLMLGVWANGARIALLGLALGALTVAGYIWFPQYFLLSMAGLGGGALMLGGFWIRGA